MLCALAAARPDLRRHALWMALAALPFFFAAPLICALAALGGREAALAVETSSALAGAALDGLEARILEERGAESEIDAVYRSESELTAPARLFLDSLSAAVRD